MKNRVRLEQILSAAVFSIVFAGSSFASTSKGISAIREKDCTEALKELTPPAESGDVKAQNILGRIYSDPDRYCSDFQTDLKQAAQWYLRAAELGDPEAQHTLAGIYQYGTGVPVDKARALKWLRKSAAHGNSTDLIEISRIYERGEDVPIDRVLAYTYRAIAAKINSRSDPRYSDESLQYQAKNMSPPQLAEAKKLVARWRVGTAVPQTSKTGHLLPSAWYRKAADAGNAQALYKLGIIYRDNLEGSVDNKKARLYLHAAAEKGHEDAQEALAQMYKCGQCGPVDLVLSYMLSSLSVRDKGARAKAQVNEMWDEILTPEQIAEAAPLISHWRVGTAIPLKTKTGHLRKVNYAEEGTAKEKATPEVIQLFAAASEGDEKTFNQLIDTIPNINDYVVDGSMLLHALILPAKSLSDSEYNWRRENDNRPTDAHMQAQRIIHLATLPAKTRMLERALQRGASLHEGTQDLHASPLHLATVFGSPEMVRLLLKHGADANQYGGNNYHQQPIQFSLALSDRGIYLPELIDPEQRAQIIMALLNAGAKMPYMALDTQELRETKKPPERPAADYLLWDGLVSLTRGSEVLALMAKTGTTPFFSPEYKSVLGNAAHAGNVDAVRWLKSRIPTGDNHQTNTDILLDAAMWAMYSNANTASALLNELVVEGMAWNRRGPMAEDSTRSYKLLNLSPRPQTSTTLLGHAVLARQYEWVTRLVKLGAPVDGSAGSRDTPLELATVAGDAEMVKLLLSLGADPAAGNTHSPLMRVVEQETKNSKSIEIMKLLLNKVIQEKKSIPNRLALALVEHVLEQNENDDIAFAVIKALVDAGFSPNKFSPHTIAHLMQSKHRELIDYLIAHGALKLESGGKLPDTYSVLLEAALLAHREDLLPLLFAAGLDPNTRIDNSKFTPLEYAILKGRKSAVATFIQKNGLPKVSRQNSWGTVLDLAIASGEEDILKTVTNNFSIRLNHACLPDTRMLVKTILDSSDAYWSTLIQHGFGSEVDGCDTMVDSLLQGVSSLPAMQQVGWVGEQFTQRLKAISNNGTRLDSLVSAETYDLLNEAGRQDIVRSLQAAGWQSKPVSTPVEAIQPVAVSTKKDITLSKKLVGHYYMQHVSEVGSELVLYDDGRFNYALSYGAVDEFAVGTWQVINGSVIFRSKVTPPQEQYRLVDAQPSKDSNVVVSVTYKKRTIPGVAITLLGEHGVKVSGVTTDKGLIASLSGPIKQIILYHDEVNNGRAFVYDLSDAEITNMARRLAFEIKPPKPTSSEFNVEMSVRDGQLVWRRGDHDVQYKKQN